MRYIAIRASAIVTLRLAHISYCFLHFPTSKHCCTPLSRAAGHPGLQVRFWGKEIYGGTAHKFCMFHKRGLLPLPPVEHTKLRSCTSTGLSDVKKGQRGTVPYPGY